MSVDWKEVQRCMRELAPPGHDDTGFPGVARWNISVCDDADAVDVRAIGAADTIEERWHGVYNVEGDELRLFMAHWENAKKIRYWGEAMKYVLRFMHQAYATLAWRVASTDPKVKRLAYYRRKQ